MRRIFVVLWMLLCSATSAVAQVSIGIGLPAVSIGINLPVFPELVQVPEYPVYYAPGLNSNYFFYDGMYWVYQGDNWYASDWYNGPWVLVAPEEVPLFVLRVPVSYYRAPPVYFRAWSADAPPRWGEHWGHAWEQRRSGWDRWDRGSVPAPAPLPVYQKKYSGDRYPRGEQQQALRSQNYHYQPREAAAVQRHQEQAARTAPSSPERGQQGSPQVRNPGQADTQHSNPAAKQAPQQQGAAPRERQTPSPGTGNVQQGERATPEPKRGQEQQGQQRAMPEPKRGQEQQGQQRAAPEPNRGQEQQGQQRAAPEPRRGQEQQGQQRATPEPNRGQEQQGQQRATPEPRRGQEQQSQQRATPEPNRSQALQGQQRATPEPNRGQQQGQQQQPKGGQEQEKDRSKGNERG
jgi:hypothetical protein